MPDCNDVVRELFAYLDGEVTLNVRTEIAAHLEGCPECYEALDFHAELRNVIARRCQDELPPGLADRIRNCFGTLEPEPGFSPFAMPPPDLGSGPSFRL